MRLDADEIIEADLAQEIHQTLPILSAGYSGCLFKAKTNFYG